MLRPLRIFLLITLIGAFNACKQHETKRIPISAFFKIPEESAFKISPDGNYISYLKAYKGKENLFIRSLADGSVRIATSFTDYPVRNDYFWTYNNEIVFFRDMVATDEFKLYTLDIANLEVKNIISQQKVRITLLNRNKLQPDIITIQMNKRDPANFDIYKLNIKTGELASYLVNPGNLTEWYPDADGKIRLVTSSDGVDKTILYRPTENAPFRRIIENNFKTQVTPIAFTGEKNYFYALSNVDRDKTALVEINAEDGKEEKVVYACPNADLQDVQYIRNKSRLELVRWEAEKPHKHFLDTGIKNIYAKLATQLKGTEINITDRDSAEDKFIVNTYTDRNPGSYWLYESKTGRLKKLGDINSSVNADELCPMKPVSFKASDGMLISGYLTLPKGPDSTNLPVVIMPHDGPFNVSFVWRYYADVQFLANRGYAVLQINFRGSTGNGKAFHSAGFKEVGGKIQQDITDGVHWLIANKIADPKKIAIFGAGFGGFSALYGVSFHPELYNCAILQHSLINFFTYIKDAPPFLKPQVKMMYEMVGDPEADAGELRAISPVFHTDKIKAPLLIFQGAKDDRANISELTQFVRELRKQNGYDNVQYILKPNERTYFRSEKNRMEMYTEIEKFLDKNMSVNH
jgi:dipeptidyl aminopeptidase/acylaminoacyl peptidase